MKKTRNCYLVI